MKPDHRKGSIFIYIYEDAKRCTCGRHAIMNLTFYHTYDHGDDDKLQCHMYGNPLKSVNGESNQDSANGESNKDSVKYMRAVPHQSKPILVPLASTSDSIPI